MMLIKIYRYILIILGGFDLIKLYKPSLIFRSLILSI